MGVDDEARPLDKPAFRLLLNVSVALVFATFFGLFFVLAAGEAIGWFVWAAVAALMLSCMVVVTVLRLRHERMHLDPDDRKGNLAILRDVLRGGSDRTQSTSRRSLLEWAVLGLLSTATAWANDEWLAGSLVLAVTLLGAVVWLVIRSRALERRAP
jgi:hypothetical protein